MYTLASIKQFVNDNAERLGDQAESIIKRAEVVSSGGLISGGSVEEIMGNNALANEFHKVAMSPKYMTAHLAVTAPLPMGSN